MRRPLKISGDADRYEQKRGVDNNYIQPGNLFRLMPPDEQQRTIAAIVGSLSKVPVEIPKKMVGALYARRSRLRWRDHQRVEFGVTMPML